MSQLYSDMFIFKGPYFWRSDSKNNAKKQESEAGLTALLLEFGDQVNLDGLNHVFQDGDAEWIAAIVDDRIYKFKKHALEPGYPKTLPAIEGYDNGRGIVFYFYEAPNIYIVTNQGKIVVVSEQTLKVVEISGQ